MASASVSKALRKVIIWKEKLHLLGPQLGFYGKSAGPANLDDLLRVHLGYPRNNVFLECLAVRSSFECCLERLNLWPFC